MALSPQLQTVLNFMEELCGDPAVPRNVKTVIQTARERLASEPDPVAGMSGAIYALDEVSNDINLPMHARTMVWNLLSELEALKEAELAKKK
ncbi:hypothetical protein COT29_02035 [Candidatus Micrarchaeota archaeon CG08_land_8_20_14_0_20_59_11]|nr:MAG: hypothetical protein COT29_02035 [Candidatus Micrarchaeota archaeon CG08_land_8_20_14_0_20_59_11]PIT85602.1 MAG: hypothetical protein COU36_02345 [Candidatus Micrarchaeota archaeon CG10_big_fil_rev_8_21_14_0_10_59_7]